jgi:hypothetical protein
MSKFWNKIAIGAALLVAATVLFSLPLGDRHAPVAQAFGTCPVSLVQSGSTTVAEYSILTEAPFEQSGGRTGPTDHLHWGPGTDLVLRLNGSNAGLLDLDANVPGGAPANVGQAQGGQMSRKPVNSGSSFEPGVIGASAGSETKYNYWWNVANDAFAMVVSTDPSMDFLFPNGLTMADMTAIWGAGAGITNLHWDELPSVTGRGLSGYPHRLIVPAFRVATGGSYTDFNAKVASVSNAVEEGTYEGLYGNDGGAHRNLGSDLMAQQAQSSPDVLAYTSLSQLATHPGVRVIPMGPNNGGPFTIANDTNIASLPSGLQRLLYVGTHDKATTSRIDNTAQVRLDDWINLSRSTQGHDIFAVAGYPVIPPAAVDAIPDHDVDLSGAVTLGDLLRVATRWGSSSSCLGFIREDENNDGKVSLADIGGVEQHWGQDGLICDAAHSCLRDPSDPPQ